MEANKHPPKPPAASAVDNSSFKTPAPPKAATRLGGTDAAAAAGAAGAKPAGAGGAAGVDSPSLTITVLDPVSTGKRMAKHLRGYQTSFAVQRPRCHGTYPCRLC